MSDAKHSKWRFKPGDLVYMPPPAPHSRSICPELASVVVRADAVVIQPAKVVETPTGLRFLPEADPSMHTKTWTLPEDLEPWPGEAPSPAWSNTDEIAQFADAHGLLPTQEGSLRSMVEYLVRRRTTVDAKAGRCTLCEEREATLCVGCQAENIKLANKPKCTLAHMVGGTCPECGWDWETARNAAAVPEKPVSSADAPDLIPAMKEFVEARASDDLPRIAAAIETLLRWIPYGAEEIQSLRKRLYERTPS